MTDKRKTISIEGLSEEAQTLLKKGEMIKGADIPKTAKAGAVYRPIVEKLDKDLKLGEAYSWKIEDIKERKKRLAGFYDVIKSHKDRLKLSSKGDTIYILRRDKPTGESET